MSASAQSMGPLFYGLFALVVIWFVLLASVWLRLISRHGALYDEMGRPHFFTASGARRTLCFLFTRAHRELGDRALTVMADAALLVLVLYVAGFVLLVCIIQMHG